MSEAVALRDVAVSWPSGFALRDLTWTVPDGGRAAIVGPSGSGKSTLLAVLAGDKAVDAGAATVLGQRLEGMGDRARRAWRVRHVGRVFQDFPLLPSLDVLDNVLLPCRLHPALRLDDDAVARARALLEALDVGALARRRPEALSQGERQRVAVARALVTRPGLVLADEPTSGLDPRRKEAVLELLCEACARDGAALVVVTHDPEVAARLDVVLDLERA